MIDKKWGCLEDTFHKWDSLSKQQKQRKKCSQKPTDLKKLFFISSKDGTSLATFIQMHRKEANAIHTVGELGQWFPT